jgi:hypothetical protein
LKARALFEHDLHDDSLDINPEGERHNEGLDATVSKEAKNRVEQNHEDEEQSRRKHDPDQLPTGLGGFTKAFPQEEFDLVIEL